jgi:hypothetical protein
MDGRIMKRVDSGFFILGRSLPPTCLLVSIVVVGGFTKPKNPQAECRLHNQKQQVEEN